jgi:hypothetical protein
LASSILLCTISSRSSGFFSGYAFTTTAQTRAKWFPRFDKWNFADTEELALSKTGVISNEGDFLRITEAKFTSYYRPLIAWINRLRRTVFSNSGRWVRENEGLYARMRQILQEAGKDLKLAEA